MQSTVELTVEKTLEHVQAIANFLRCYEALWGAHVVEFFNDRLWEAVDIQWWSDLESASIQDLLWLPSGKVQDTWCASLKIFVKTAQSLALFRQPGEDIKKIFPGFCKPRISNLLRQGMNAKKLHEVESLAGVISQIFRATKATHVVDVGAGQGYLAQVLAFEYGIPVVALDAIAHHANVTNRRSERLKKHYTACLKKANPTTISQEVFKKSGPQTATFQVNSGATQMELQYFLSTLALEKMSDPLRNSHRQLDQDLFDQGAAYRMGNHYQNSYVLTGLHACGDLTSTILKTYINCQEVKAIAIVGCCYNLLSENCNGAQLAGIPFGFPLSEGVKKLGITLGRRAFDLACQSAERWKDIGIESALYNFAQHGLRAGFQLVLQRYYPDLAKANPTIGRLGKSRRRKQATRHVSLESSVQMSNESCQQHGKDSVEHAENASSSNAAECNKTKFAEFCASACQRLGIECLAQEQLQAVWEDIKPKTAMVGPYWSLRAVLGPVLETLILLDRLLYLQEQSPVESGPNTLVELQQPKLIALFDPRVSPRNMAVMAIKSPKME